VLCPVWAPGDKTRAVRTTNERSAKTLDKAPRHNLVQNALFQHLEEITAKETRAENSDCGNGTPVDVVVNRKDGYVYYELKTGLSAQSCIRCGPGAI
jgi:hypothetical protein